MIYEDGRTGGRTDGQTYMMQPTAAFRGFADAPKYVDLHYKNPILNITWENKPSLLRKS